MSPWATITLARCRNLCHDHTCPLQELVCPGITARAGLSTAVRYIQEKAPKQGFLRWEGFAETRWHSCRLIQVLPFHVCARACEHVRK